MSSRLSNFVGWSSNILRYNGLLILCWRWLQRGWRPLGTLELVTFLQKDLTQPLIDVKALDGLTITLATVFDIESLVKLMKERQNILGVAETKGIEDLVLSRFQRGSLCFLGKIGPKIIHYNWTSFNWEQSLGGRFVLLKPDEAFCLDAFTLREWRGKGVYPAAHYRMLQVLQQKGYQKAYTLVDADNRSSQKTHYRQAWKALGTALCFTPHGTSQGRIWRIKGKLARFLEKNPDAANP